jgi:hypothetical protein
MGSGVRPGYGLDLLSSLAGGLQSDGEHLKRAIIFLLIVLRRFWAHRTYNAMQGQMVSEMNSCIDFVALYIFHKCAAGYVCAVGASEIVI